MTVRSGTAGTENKVFKLYTLAQPCSPLIGLGDRLDRAVPSESELTGSPNSPVLARFNWNFVAQIFPSHHTSGAPGPAVLSTDIRVPDFRVGLSTTRRNLSWIDWHWHSRVTGAPSR